MAGPSFPWSLFIPKAFWLVLIFSSFDGVADHLKPSSSRGNLTTTSLTNLTPEEQDFSSFTLNGALYNPSRNYSLLPSLPSGCWSYSQPGGECPTEIRAVNISYDDCSDSWTLCHCSSANITLDDSVSRLGKVPVGLRKYIATTVVLPADDAHAYTLTNGDIYCFGDLAMNVWIHEATHAYDYAFGDPFSGSQEWLNAIGNDTCATDVYGLTNAAEEFAQSSVLKIYSLIYGSLPPGWNASCMSHQQGFLGTLPLYDKTTLFADTCASNSTLQGSSKGPLALVRPVKSNGPLLNPKAPLRIDSNANSTVSSPDSVPQGGPGEENSALSRCFGGNIWSFIIILIVQC